MNILFFKFILWLVDVGSLSTTLFSVGYNDGIIYNWCYRKRFLDLDKKHSSDETQSILLHLRSTYFREIVPFYSVVIFDIIWRTTAVVRGGEVKWMGITG